MNKNSYSMEYMRFEDEILVLRKGPITPMNYDRVVLPP